MASGVYLFISRSPRFISAIPKTMIRHYSSIIFTCHFLQPSSILLLRVGNTCLISSPFDVTKLQKKLSWCLIDWQFSIPNINGQAYSYPLTTLWWWGLNLDLNGMERVVIHLSVPKNYGFDINYQWIFLQVTLLLWVLEVHINGITVVTIHIIKS